MGGNLEHLLWDWECPGLKGRPPDKPVDKAQARLGWPSGLPARAGSDGRILLWLQAVKEYVLKDRYAGKFSPLPSFQCKVLV